MPRYREPPEQRARRIARLAEQVQQGVYEPDPEKIAEAMLDRIDILEAHKPRRYFSTHLHPDGKSVILYLTKGTKILGIVADRPGPGIEKAVDPRSSVEFHYRPVSEEDRIKWRQLVLDARKKPPRRGSQK